MTEQTHSEYMDRVLRVENYIREHLDEKLELSVLASVSHFSEFHFHRIFSAYRNEPVWAYITRLRMNRAAELILRGEEAVTDIAIRVGYENPSSFHKAFRKHFGVAPGEFKKDHDQTPHTADIINAKNMEINVKPRVRTLKPKNVCYVQRKGAYTESAKDAWQAVCDFIGRKRLWGWRTEFIGISYDDPTVTEASELRYDACVTVRKQTEPEEGIGFKTIPGGKYAIFRYKGPYENLNDVYAGIYKNWLPQSGYELRDAHGFEKYLNHPEKTKPENLLTEIYVPVL